MNEKRKGLFKRLLSNEYESEASEADVRKWLSEPDERGRPIAPTTPGAFDYRRASGPAANVGRPAPPGFGPSGPPELPTPNFGARPAPRSSAPPPQGRQAEPFHYEPTIPAPAEPEAPQQTAGTRWETPSFQSIPPMPERPAPVWGRPKPPAGGGRPSSASYMRPPRGGPSFDRPSSFDRPASYDRPAAPSFERPAYTPEPAPYRPEPAPYRPTPSPFDHAGAYAGPSGPPPWSPPDDVDEGGVEIVDLPRGTPLEAAGVRVGDVITAVNGMPTPTEDELAQVFQSLRPGQTARLTMRRGGAEMFATIVLPS
ncbi:MAG TPA: PDZ domain-containing protein [Candidatus Dormibacteraeota bacterium]|nr:PDZ domain-containing protein [Candidatus Dormibacteraeota bacterium]